MLFGTLTVVFDIVQVTYRRLPFIVSGTVIAVFSLIAYAFRAALAPIKMLITAAWLNMLTAEQVCDPYISIYCSIVLMFWQSPLVFFVMLLQDHLVLVSGSCALGGCLWHRSMGLPIWCIELAPWWSRKQSLYQSTWRWFLLGSTSFHLHHHHWLGLGLWCFPFRPGRWAKEKGLQHLVTYCPRRRPDLLAYQKPVEDSYVSKETWPFHGVFIRLTLSHHHELLMINPVNATYKNNWFLKDHGIFLHVQKPSKIEAIQLL